MRFSRRPSAPGMLAVLGIAAFTARADVPAYEVLLLDGPTLGAGSARDLNAAGDVVGSIITPAGERAFVATGGVVRILASLPDTVRSAATGISDTGLIVGWSLPPGNFAPIAVRWADANAQPERIGTFGGADSSAEAISPDGRIVSGWARPKEGDSFSVAVGFQAFVHQGLGLEHAGTLVHGSWSTVADINDAGTAVGSGGSTIGFTSAVVFLPGEGAVELPTIGGINASAHAISSTGDAVGTAGTGRVIDNWEVERAVLWTGHAVHTLEPLPGFESSWASGVNDSVWVVGDSLRRSTTSPWVFRPTLWTTDGAHDLQTLLAAGAPTITKAVRINNAGMIAGTARSGSVTKPCILRPIADIAPIAPPHAGETNLDAAPSPEPVRASAPRYRVVRAFAVDDNAESWATAIAPDGTLVGSFHTTDRNERWSFVATPTHDGWTVDQIPPYSESGIRMRTVDALAVNDSTVVVGRHQRPLGGALQHAFVTFDTVFPTLLDPLPSALHAQLTGLTRGPTPSASGMIAPGELIGSGTPITRAVRLRLDGQLNDPDLLPTLGGPSSHGLDINAQKSVVGWSLTDAGPRHAVFWTDSAPPAAVDLGTFGGAASQAHAVTDAGTVVGWAAQADGSPRAFEWDGSLNALPAPPSSASVAHDRNAAGDTVGWIAAKPHVRRAALWNHDGPHDLNALIPADSGWTLFSAEAINDEGFIVGVGRFDGRREAFLLLPLCPADLNADGMIDNSDVSAFLTAFAAGDPTADINGDGILDFGDVSAFVAAFSAGC